MRDAQPATDSEMTAGEIVSFGPFQFDRESLLLFRDGVQIPLVPRALSVLDCLLQRPGKLASKKQLLDAAWGETAVTEDSLVEAIGLLRQALGDSPEQPTYIQTVHRRGYRFIAAVEVEEVGLVAEKEVWGVAFLETLSRGLQSLATWERSILRASVLLLAVVATVATLGLWRYWSISHTAPTSQPTTRLAMSLPSNLPVYIGGKSPPVAISRDGTRVVYVAGEGDRTQLVLKEMGRLGFTRLPETGGGRWPFFSPDGNWIGFMAKGDAHSPNVPPLAVPWVLKKMALDGSPPVTVGAGYYDSATWGPDNSIYIGSRSGLGAAGVTPGVRRISADSGEQEVLTTEDSSGDEEHRWPRVLPDGDALLYTVVTSGILEDYRTVVFSLETGEQRTLLEGVADARYVPTGHLVYTRENTLWARPFDLSNLEVRGKEVRVIERITGTAWRGAAAMAFSDTGTLIYHGSSEPSPRSDLSAVWVDRSNGASRPLSFPTDGCHQPSLSPDGQELALACRRGRGESRLQIGLGNLERGTLTRWPSEGEDFTPIWTPDGDFITYTSRQADRWSINLRPADGNGPAEQLLESEHSLYAHSWSPDGKVLAFQWSLPDTGEDIWLLPLEGERRPRPFIHSPSNESGARFSPDGKWMAYHSNESGSWHAYVKAYPGPGPKIQVSTGGGGWPVWSQDGRELFYVATARHSPDLPAGAQAMMVVDISYEPDFSPGKARRLFEANERFARLGPGRGLLFDIAPDGQSFLMVERGLSPATELTVVLNWFEELKRLVPVEQ